ncbi:MAG: TRAP transporter small permease [Deltaproteobacteria bacterium]|nr:TRAP transporter small permease [Deltaproteobacteria bacterium]
MKYVIYKLAELMNLGAALCVLAMMLLTAADVVLRLFRHPILGAYEMVGLLGALTIALAMPATTRYQGHVAVEFIMEKLPPALQKLGAAGAASLSLLLFLLIAWQSFVYAGILRRTGEVTLSLQLPFFPVVYAIAAASLLVALVILLELLPAATQDNPA